MDGTRETTSLGTLFWTFLKIGATAFGGFMALISVVQNYVVDRRRLMSLEEMLDGVSLATILPGPVAFNVVAYTGYRLRGVPGAVVATVAVTLPTFVLVVALSYAYFTWGEVPAVTTFFAGVIPAVAAIIVAAAWNMGRKVLVGRPEQLLALGACLILLLGGGFIATLGVVFGAAAVGYFLFRPQQPPGAPAETPPREATRPPRKFFAASVPTLYAAAPFFSTDLLLAAKVLAVFAGMSLLLFGGGFVFIPLIQEIVVGHLGWVSHKEFIDGIALGQVTPGPILISAAFIGYKLAGLAGAAAATIGIFTPPAVVMVISSRYLQRIKSNRSLSAALRGVRAGVVGMILAAAWVVAATAPLSWISAAIFACAMTALLRFRIEVAWIIPAAGLVGLALY